MSCPTCKRRVEWNASSPWRPFCSERCKLIDLGAWASQQHTIPGDAERDADAEAGNDDSLPFNPGAT
jgi:endogenous inhibitor of DNA gyrase (YacG/DUF329 family)